MKYATLVAVALPLLSACTKDEERTEIRLTTRLEAPATTRAGQDLQKTQFAADAKVGVFVDDYTAGSGDAAATTTAMYTNRELTADGSGVFAGTPMYFPETGHPVNITAYHPYDAAAVAMPTEFSVKANQTADADYMASDLMFGAPTNGNPVDRTNSSVELTFKHLLTKVNINLTTGAGTPDLTQAVVKLLGMTQNCTVAADGTVTLPTTPTSGAITAASATSTAGTTPATALNCSAIVVPQTVAKGTQFLEITLKAGGTLRYTLPDTADLTLEPKKVHTYNIAVDLTGLTVTSTITDWDATTAVSGNAVM
jgi:hypothetical protein